MFDPRDHRLTAGCHEFAQAPHALELDDRVRVFFSSRSRDQGGKFLSHVHFVDLSLDLSAVLRVSKRPVITLGELGCFDEHGIFPLNVVRVGSQVWGYICGWSRRVSVSVETAIGLAVSDDDGESFERVGPGPLIGATPEEPFLVGDPFVLKSEGVFHMWYIFGTKWERYEPDGEPERTYKIGHLTSPDGRRWSEQLGRPIIEDRLGTNEAQALPSVARLGSRYHMVFCYRYSSGFRRTPGRAYRLGYAFSDDLRTWTRDDDALELSSSSDGWDSEMMCYPNLFRGTQGTFLLYNGNAFGRRGFGAAVLE